MAKQYIFLIVLLSVASMAAKSNGATPIKEFLRNIDQVKSKVTELQLYVQDIFTSPTPSNLPVAFANSTSASPTLFGLMAVLDDPIRVEPKPDAMIVGQAQGFFAFSSLEDTSFHMTFDLVFTRGKYNGSTLNVMGHNAYMQPRRELSIVGGTGAFRLARGIIGVSTVSMNATTGDAFFQYNITILHY
ncbi:hypothetical protein ABFS83_02G010600 [Erythranthe nasuta]